MRKGIGKGTAELVKNKVTIEEAKEFLKTIRKADYSDPIVEQISSSDFYFNPVTIF